MAKRKETRTCCTYAIRNRAAECRTEFKLLDFDGEGDDFMGLLLNHEEIDVLNEEECASILVDAGFQCSGVKIEVVPE